MRHNAHEAGHLPEKCYRMASETARHRAERQAHRLAPSWREVFGNVPPDPETVRAWAKAGGETSIDAELVVEVGGDLGLWESPGVAEKCSRRARAIDAEGERIARARRRLRRAVREAIFDIQRIRASIARDLERVAAD